MTDLRPVRFGAFELDLHTHELRKHGIRIKLQDQPFQVLQALVERPGEMVSREEIQRRIWGENTFVDIDQSLNRAVNKVREALGDTAENPRYIETMARRGYRFVAQVESAPKPKEPVAAPAPVAGRPWGMIALAAAGVLAVAGVGLWLTRDRPTLPAMRLVQLTTYPGYENTPAFSPDGKYVAFSGEVEARGNMDLYIKMVGSVTPSRLTSDPAYDGYPAWSPDGRQIAFLSWREGGGIYVVSSNGGPQRKVAGLTTNSRPTWTPDGKHLLVAKTYQDTKSDAGDGALFLIPVEGEGAPHQVLTPPLGSWYRDPAFSPDGRSLAFVSCTGVTGAASCSLQFVATAAGLVSAGEPRQISNTRRQILGIAWTADSSSLMYSGGVSAGTFFLWRVHISDGREPERLELAPDGAFYPTIDVTSGRLAYSRTLGTRSIWRMGSGGKPAPFLTSSGTQDQHAQYSPDGRRIVFHSNRHVGSLAIWVANADGTGAAQISNIDSPASGTPRWSPDGRWIAFDARRKDGGWDVWVVEASGSSPRQLTHDPGNDVVPSWSRDGSSVYFASNRSGRFEIWRIPALGGKAEQVTRQGGQTAFESTDGKTLYYTLSDHGTEGLYAKSLADGEEKQVVKDGVARRGFTVFSDGVYYLHWTGNNSSDIRFHEFASGRTRFIGEVGGDLGYGLTVSPDRKTFLFTKWTDPGGDLMLIENFR